jgi:hypothetical protein
MRRREILQDWMRRYGRLSPASQGRFLRRQETIRLTRYRDDIVGRAISWSNLLSDAVRFAHSAYEGEAKPIPPEPQSPSQPPSARRVAEAQPRRNLDLERRLKSTIGPVQNYEDSF